MEIKLPLKVGGNGAWLYDADGKFLADFTHSKYSCAQVRENAAFVATLSAQLSEAQARLAESHVDDMVRELREVYTWTNRHRWSEEIWQEQRSRIADLLDAAPVSPAAKVALNQCDGCARGLIVENGIHKDANGHAYIACQAYRYKSPAAASAPWAITVQSSEVYSPSGEKWKDLCAAQQQKEG